jgi:23S rRNA pseudouridine1911/1915/1917 synthase
MNMASSPKAKTLQFNSPVADSRLDKYLARVLPQLSRAHLQKLIEQGSVLVNGRPSKASRRLNVTDRITVELPPLPGRPSAEPMPLSIIYEDADLVVVNKPAGLTVHPAPGHPSHTLVNAILAHSPHLARGDEPTRPGIVHRLDKDTSGLMVIAKSDSALEYVATQFKSRTVTKGYLVLVKGRLSPEQGIIEAPIGRDPHRRQRMAVVGRGKEATTRYKVRRYLDSYTLLEVIPVTGRTHQIRVHLSAIGYPVAGDPVYGVKSVYLNRQFVHAYRLGFYLPSTRQYREFISPLPADLEQALQQLAQNA